MTVLVIAGTALRGSRKRTVDRVVGTLAGVLVALGLSATGLPPAALVTLGVAAIVGSLAVAGTSSRWSTTLSTLAVVLVAAPAAVADTAVRRLGYTVAGALVLAAGAVVARVVLPRLRRPHERATPDAG